MTDTTQQPSALTQHYINMLVQTHQWHAEQVDSLNTIEENPNSGIQFTSETDPDAPPITLTPEQAKGFRIGIKTALHYLGKLPYSLEAADESGEEEAE